MAISSVTHHVCCGSNPHDRSNDVATHNQQRDCISTTEAAQVSRDIAGELTDLFREEKRKAYDAGALGLIDSVIQLSEMSGGRLNTRQLRDYKEYITRTLERKNSEEQIQQQEADEAIRSESRGTYAKVVELPGVGAVVRPDISTEAGEPQEGPGSEAVPQAESS